MPGVINRRAWTGPRLGVWLARVLAVIALSGCAVDAPPIELPSCASLGCPLAPSGTGDLSQAWEPCDDDQDVCYCRTSDTTIDACTVER